MKDILTKLAWCAIGMVAVMAVLLGLPRCASIPTVQAPVCQAVQIKNPKGEVVLDFALPNDPGASFITSTTDWMPVAVLGEKQDCLLLAVLDPKDNSIIWFLLVQAKDGKLVPLCLSVEDQKQIQGKRFVKGWWYGGKNAQCPEEMDKDALIKTLKAHLGVADGSI